jgi:F420-dependent oxidoreductase-like protein
MKIGLQIPSFTWPGGTAIIGKRLAEIARTADEAGFDSIWTMDHFFQIRGVGKPEEPMLEAYNTLGFIAANTQHVRLGAMVSGVIYRHPSVLVKIISTLDVLSGGRANLGIGAAWNDQESHALGIAFPEVKERFEILEETLQIFRQMWSGKEGEYHGKYFQLERALNSPQPLTRPHPPIFIGGGGEKKTLRLVARYGDACNLFSRMGPDEVRKKLDILKQHCETEGRDYNQITKSALDTIHIAPGQMTTGDLITMCRELHDLGFQYAIFNMPNVHELTPLEKIGKEVIPEVAGL